jgi:hypothetical protein
MTGLKKWVLFLFLGAVVFLGLSLVTQGQYGHRANPGGDGSVAFAAESAPNYPVMPGPGKKVPLVDDFYLTYGFDKKPKLGTVIMKVEIFAKDGKKDTSFEVKADYGMPSMKGAHESGDQAFKLSQKGDYLLPVNIVMPGGWEIRMTILKAGKIVFRGSYQFNV